MARRPTYDWLKDAVSTESFDRQYEEFCRKKGVEYIPFRFEERKFAQRAPPVNCELGANDPFRQLQAALPGPVRALPKVPYDVPWIGVDDPVDDPADEPADDRYDGRDDDRDYDRGGGGKLGGHVAGRRRDE